MTRHYFAYGSNMHPGQMKERCPSSKLLGKALLEQHILRFNKKGMDQTAKANIMTSAEANSQVWGVLYRLEDEDFRNLDGHEIGYDRQEIQVLFEGNATSCLTYRAREDYLCTGIPPTEGYVKRILEAAKLHDFPENFFDFLRRAISSL